MTTRSAKGKTHALAWVRERIHAVCMLIEKLDFVTRLGQAVWHLRSFSSARPEAVALGSAARPERSGEAATASGHKDGSAHL